MKKIKLKEGDFFSIPLTQGGYGIGLVAREYRTITLGYFFDIIYQNIPEKINDRDIRNWRIALIGIFSSLGIKNGEWPLLKTDFIFNKEEWPIPIFKTQEPLTEKYFAVKVDITLMNDERYLISEEEAKAYFKHVSYGYESLSKQLSTILYNKNY
ncbi:MAG: hypothetical protein KGZ74_04410 [Chitinophagaceae bacterium]|nr:hypothetical protein [Chitinophagaceae bacterium]